MNAKPNPSPPAVLIVEDEFLIMEDMADVLEASGYPVRRAWNGEEALDILEEHDDIGIVFTDINMPGRVNGLALAEQIGERWPCIRLILTSGAVRAAELDLPAAGCFIPKPYPPQAVVRTIDRMLAGSSPARR